MEQADDPRKTSPANDTLFVDPRDRFREALRQSATVELTVFLPPPSAPDRLRLLRELLRIEWEYRCRQGKTIALEDEVQRFPELGPLESLPVDLICEEYRIRSLYGDAPTVQGYRDRFPHQYDALLELLRSFPAETVHTSPPSGPVGSPEVPATVAPHAERDSQTTPAGRPSPAAAPTLRHAVRPADAGVVSIGDGGYRKKQRLGAGQYGEVFLAEAPGGVEVAVKSIFRSLQNEASQREVQALELIRSLRHPFLLSTLAWSTQNDRINIVMELADGSLADRFDECKIAGQPGIPAEEMVRYLLEAAEALDFLHANNVMHRDVKPANILRLQGHAKVADFGLARVLETKNQVTATFCGTPLYMAPEIWLNQVHVHSDQYALATTYVELRTGQRLFEATNQFELARQHIDTPPNLAGLTEAERPVLERALAKDPDDRYPTCLDFARAVQLALFPPTEIEVVRKRPMWQTALLAASIGLLLAATAESVRRLMLPPDIEAAEIGPAGLAGLERAFEESPRAEFLPAGFDPDDGAKLVRADGRLLFDRIVRPMAGAPPAVFVLIPRRLPSDPAPFYLMRDKVSNAQLAAAERDPRFQELLTRLRGTRPWTTPGKWRAVGLRPENADLPAFGVSVTEAHCFAQWLAGPSGVLPTGREWDKAAGTFDGQPGPFRAGWQPGDLALYPATASQAALAAAGVWARHAVPEAFPVRPRPVGSSPGDISLFGVRDLAANGREWTRDIVDNFDRQTVPLDKPDPERDYVELRGKSYLSSEPHTARSDPSSTVYGDTQNDIGFRVAIEMPVEAS